MKGGTQKDLDKRKIDRFNLQVDKIENTSNFLSQTVEHDEDS